VLTASLQIILLRGDVSCVDALFESSLCVGASPAALAAGCIGVGLPLARGWGSPALRFF
jgi:hypothetical protein